MAFLDWLSNHPLVRQYEVLDYYDLDDATLLKLRIILVDGSLLFTKEYVDEFTRKYAFQWQQADNQRIIRWDNAPHFSKIASFPHHKHDYRQDPETVTDSIDISLVEVLTYIRNQLTNL